MIGLSCVLGVRFLCDTEILPNVCTGTAEYLLEFSSCPIPEHFLSPNRHFALEIFFIFSSTALDLHQYEQEQNQTSN